MAQQSPSTHDLASLPPEVREAIGGVDGLQRVPDEEVASLGDTIGKLRDEAVAARKESGIEDVWLEREEAYLGIDDENRAEFAGARWAKPMAMEGPLTRQRMTPVGGSSVKATAFIRLTSRYVDAGAAKVCEIALPIDGKSFTLRATPVPEMSLALGDDTPAEQITGQPMPGPDGQPVTVDQLAQHVISEADTAAEKAADRINDWLVEGKHLSHMRRVIFDMSRLGVGVIKGPVPVVRTATVVRRVKQPQAMDAQPGQAQPSAISVERVKQTKPATMWVDPWRFYPAPGCGEDIHSGGHCFERDTMLASELRKLAKTDGDGGFDKAAIDKVIAEGPGKSNILDTGAGRTRDEAGRKKQFDVWHFHGVVSREDFAQINPAQGAKISEGETEVFAVVTLVNDTPIRAIQQPLDSRRLPYQVASWTRREGHWAGVGPGEQVQTPQRIVNSAWRALLNNAGKSAGSQVVMRGGSVRPANPSDGYGITPDKLWFLDETSGIDDVRKAFSAFPWPNMTPQLLTVIEAGFKLAEEHSSIPLITQGQSGKTTPDTFSGQQLQDNNANQLLRSVGATLSDSITAPLVDQFYEWLLLDPDVPDDEKGDYQVDTSGALALIEKALQDQSIAAIMGNLLQNRAFKIDPSRAFIAWCRAKRLNPEDFQYTDEEWKASLAQIPPMPQVQAATIRAEAQVKVAESHDNLAAQRNKIDIDRDTAYNDSLAQRAQSDHELALQELGMRRELAMLDYANKNQITLDTLKAKLADTTMRLQVQRELAMAEGKVPQVATPPDEPPGRAPDGQAYQK